MIKDFFNTTYTIKRSVWTTDGNGNPYSTEATVSTFAGHIQQAAPEVAASLALTFTKTFSLWCQLGTNVREGDTITDGTTTYSVKAVMNYANGTNKHMELIVTEDGVTEDEGDAESS